MLLSVINQDGKNLNFLDLEKSMSIKQTLIKEKKCQ